MRTFVFPWPAALLFATTLAFRPVPLAAQQPDTLAIPTGPAASVPSAVRISAPEGAPSPGGAFLRAVLIPGWGHASIGSYSRGAFYFAAEATTGIMLARTLRRLGVAEDARDLEETRLTEVLLAQGVSADSIPARLDGDQSVDDARALVDARRQQLEDWIALGAFLVLFGGADAFVSAHLSDFPAPLEPQARLVPGPGGTTAELGISVRVGPPGRRR